MAGRKEFRDLTVGDIYRNEKKVPMFRLSGFWLEKLGVQSGDFVRIRCEDGQLIITRNGKKALEKAAEIKKLQKRYEKEKDEICTRFVAEREVGYTA